MKKWFGKGLPGLVLSVVLLVVALAGCGATTESTSDVAPAATSAAAKPGVPTVGGNGSVNYTAADTATSESKAYGNTGGAQSIQTTASTEGDSIADGSNSSQEASNAILAERKIIRSANITIEVENFDEAYGKISNIILGIGFIQETNINSEKVYVDDKPKLVKKGTIVLRVDKDKFDKVLNNVKGIGDVFNWTINGEDVTDKYIDTESRLRLLRLEEARLEEYLKKLNDIDQIFKTESRITEITQEIESLTGNLKKMSDLVDLSTITINMNEKSPVSTIQEKPRTYGQRLLDNMLGSVKGVINFCGELLIILVAALPVLILIGLLVLVAIKIYRKVSGNSGGSLKRTRPSESVKAEAKPEAEAKSEGEDNKDVL